MFISKKLLAIAAASFLGTAFAFPASAETISGQLENADQNSIVGWVWDTEDYNHILNVELHIYPAGSEKEIVTLTTKADFYREDLQTSIGDGYHGFTCPVDWNELEGNEFSITAYAVSDLGKTPLAETISYKKISIVEPVGPQTPASGVQTAGPGTPPGGQAGPAVPLGGQTGPEAPLGGQAGPGASSGGQAGPGGSAPAPVKEAAEKGESLGLFTTSGYCTCELCCAGESESLTFSGTVPQAEHTISADLDLLPLGTKVIINDVVYTVEDKGSSVLGNRIDIYYASHEEAVAHGAQEVEVFLAKQ